MERKWRENEEMERGNFIPLYPFPASKIVSFCRKMLNTALLSQMSKKTYHTLYEKIIPGRIRSEKGPQVVGACNQLSTFLGESYHETARFITNRKPNECWEY